MIKTLLLDYNEDKNKTIAKYYISTVRIKSSLKWIDELLGTFFDDYRYEDDEIYETMVFRIKNGINKQSLEELKQEDINWKHLEVRRYKTIDKAFEGHYDIVGKWMDKGNCNVATSEEHLGVENGIE